MLLVIIDIGIAVKKIVAILQKYALPESTWSFLPFSDETARAAQISAIVPARICIGNRICIISFPLNSRSFTSPYVARVCEGQICLYNIFTTFVVCFCVSHYLNILVVSVV